MNWSLLDMAPTKDKKAIKQAYRTQLVSVNPEEKPEEFKALRAAYEEALRLADPPGKLVWMLLDATFSWSERHRTCPEGLNKTPGRNRI